jgi:hypothetical protein
MGTSLFLEPFWNTLQTTHSYTQFKPPKRVSIRINN